MVKGQDQIASFCAKIVLLQSYYLEFDTEVAQRRWMLPNKFQIMWSKVKVRTADFHPN